MSKCVVSACRAINGGAFEFLVSHWLNGFFGQPFSNFPAIKNGECFWKNIQFGPMNN